MRPAAILIGYCLRSQKLQLSWMRLCRIRRQLTSAKKKEMMNKNRSNNIRIQNITLT